jgi:hypothetical protein
MKVVGTAEVRDVIFDGNVAGSLGAAISGDFGIVTVRDVTFTATNKARESDSRDVFVGASG